jgi:hypothetical protein
MAGPDVAPQRVGEGELQTVGPTVVPLVLTAVVVGPIIPAVEEPVLGQAHTGRGARHFAQRGRGRSRGGGRRARSWHIYLHRRDQKFCCLEWATGSETWVSQERFGQYWSLVTDGERILALDQKGELLLLRPSPKEFVLLERRRVSDQDTRAHLAVVDGQLFIRELKGITAWAWAL